jgi:N6-L-threonylcarbamoyladenine synthase
VLRRILAIETSCDETATAVVEVDPQPSAAGLPTVRILTNLIYTQSASHARFGGVVPEVASREHLAKLHGLVQQATEPIGGVRRLDALCVSRGPGLVGALLVGVQLTKGLALALRRPWLGVHHLEGHLSAVLLAPKPPSAPHLALLASGGHTQFVAVQKFGRYRLLGGTRDDAAGEAFDKTAKLLGLGYPGGAAIEAAARQGDPRSLRLPQALPQDDTACSFSGLKSAVARHLAQQVHPLSVAQRADLCAAVQQAICAVLVGKAVRLAQAHGLPGIVLAGGVAANACLREMLQVQAGAAGLWTCAPPKALCTDNAAMIGAAGALRLVAGQRSENTLSVVSRWPLESLPPCDAVAA